MKRDMNQDSTRLLVQQMVERRTGEHRGAAERSRGGMALVRVMQRMHTLVMRCTGTGTELHARLYSRSTSDSSGTRCTTHRSCKTSKTAGKHTATTSPIQRTPKQRHTVQQSNIYRTGKEIRTTQHQYIISYKDSNLLRVHLQIYNL